MSFYHNSYFYYALTLLFSSCTILSKPEVRVVGPVHYTHQVSKKENKYESDLIVPKSSISIARLSYNATTQIIYTEKNEYGKDKGSCTVSIKIQVDTIRLAESNSAFKPTEYLISGSFKRSTESMPNWKSEDKGIVFYSDGFCIRTTVSNHSDSSCSNTTQVKGVYRTEADSIYVTYFLTRSLLNYYPMSEADFIKSLEQRSWRVNEPSSVIYALSSNKDTLYNVSNANNPKVDCFLRSSDSLILNSNPSSR